MDRLSLFLFLFSVISLGQAHYKETVYRPSHIYTFYADDSDDVPWDEADFRCAWHGSGHLVYIKSWDMNQAVYEATDSWGNRESWIGAHDKYTEGYMYWNDGTKLSEGYQNWGSGEPNDHFGEDCADFVSPNNYWNDEDCGHKYGFICQKETSTSTARDYTEVVYVKTNSIEKSVLKQRCSALGYHLVETKKYGSVPVNLPPNLRDLRTKYQRECLVMGRNGFKRQICDQTLSSVCEAIHSYNLKISTVQEDYMELDKIEIDCTASGIPLPNVTWHRGYALVPESSDEDIYQTSRKGKSTLIIKKAQPTDTSRYRCFAENKVGDTVKRIKGYLDIRVHPQTLTRSENKLKSANIQEDSILSTDLALDQPSSCQETNKNSWMIPTIFGFNILILILLFVITCRSLGQASPKISEYGHEFTNTNYVSMYIFVV
uniref:uncharacterized protein LOC120325865 n=1 Tax=Styela clava TaxID=7725 RepID=UPI0019398DE3|nr:uncharacterized protein LOC120325865 [Styela clava]